MERMEMARPERFELPTTRFEAEYSIQLSYGRTVGLARRLSYPMPVAWRTLTWAALMAVGLRAVVIGAAARRHELCAPLLRDCRAAGPRQDAAALR
jgi:hypothetical protein